MKTSHHLFTYYEIKEALINIFGEPETDTEHRFLQRETIKSWKRIPQYDLEEDKHKDIPMGNKMKIGNAFGYFNDRLFDILKKSGINKKEVKKIKALTNSFKNRLNGNMKENERKKRSLEKLKRF